MENSLMVLEISLPMILMLITGIGIQLSRIANELKRMNDREEKKNETLSELSGSPE